MKEDLKKILQELYEVDPNLKNKESELLEIIKKIIELKPNIKIDEDFKKQLKQKIYEEINIKKIGIKSGKEYNFKILFSYIFGAVGVLSLISVVYLFGLNNEKNPLISPTNQEIGKFISFNNFVKDFPQGFGNLSETYLPKHVRGGESTGFKNFEQSVKNSENVPLISDMSTLEQRKLSFPDSKADDSITPSVFRYNFTGDLNIDLKGKLPVYKKTYSKMDVSVLSDLIKKLNFNGMNLDKISPFDILNISLSQVGQDSYNVNINLSQNSIDLFKKVNSWDNGDKQIEMKEEEIINIAQNFVEENNIDLSNYGKAQLEENYYEVMKNSKNQNSESYYTTNYFNVIYPLLLDGNEVLDDESRKIGISINVGLKEKKVISVFGLGENSYLKSDYNIETNKENILKIASVGGREALRDEIVYDNANYIDINLKNPKFVYTRFYKYEDSQDQTYFVPSIVFETQKTDKFPFTDYVIVSLVKDFYKYDKFGKIIGAK